MFSTTPQRLTLDCAKCGRVSVTITLPGVPADLARLIVPLIRIAAMKNRVDVPADLSALAASNGPAIARFLCLTCSSCEAERPTSHTVGLLL